MVNDEQLTWPEECGYRKNPEGITIYETQTLILPLKSGILSRPLSMKMSKQK